jgi:hypothetical protein
MRGPGFAFCCINAIGCDGFLHVVASKLFTRLQAEIKNDMQDSDTCHEEDCRKHRIADKPLKR